MIIHSQNNFRLHPEFHTSIDIVRDTNTLYSFRQRGHEQSSEYSQRTQEQYKRMVQQSKDVYSLSDADVDFTCYSDLYSDAIMATKRRDADALIHIVHEYIRIISSLADEGVACDALFSELLFKDTRVLSSGCVDIDFRHLSRAQQSADTYLLTPPSLFTKGGTPLPFILWRGLVTLYADLNAFGVQHLYSIDLFLADAGVHSHDEQQCIQAEVSIQKHFFMKRYQKNLDLLQNTFAQTLRSPVQDDSPITLIPR